VRSSFRFNTQDYSQLKELTRLLRQGRSWKSQLRRKSQASSQPFNEFTRFVKFDTTTTSTATGQPSATHSASVPKPNEETQHQYSHRAAGNDNLTRSQHVRTSSNFDEDLSLVTSRASRVTVSGEDEERSLGPPLHNRTSNDRSHNPRNRVEHNSEIRYNESSERRPQGASTRRESEQSSLVGQNTRRHSRSDRPQQSDIFGEEDALSRSMALEKLHISGSADDGRRGSAQLHSPRPAPARRSLTYHRDHGYQITTEAPTHPNNTAAVTRQDESKHLGQEQALSDDKEQNQMTSPSWRRESDSSSITNYGASREAFNTPDTSSLTQGYSSSTTRYGAATGGYTTPATATAYSNQSYSGSNIKHDAATAGHGALPTAYSSPNTNYGPAAAGYGAPATAYSSSNAHYGAATTSYSAPVTAYSTSPPTQARTPSFKDSTTVQARPRGNDNPQNTKISVRPSSHAAQGTSLELPSGPPRSKPHQAKLDDDDTFPVIKVKSQFPTAGIDQQVLALYLKHWVDPKARIGRGSANGRESFVVEASRKVTRDEIEDIIRDSESWKREREEGRGRGGYRDSETARSRRRAGGGT
jgi:hypothetical protein